MADSIQNFTFTRGNVARGKLTRVRTGEFVEFALNPLKIKDNKGATLSSDSIPGFSHPQTNWASGNKRVISFTLQIDGDVSLRRRGRQIPNYAEGAPLPPDDGSTNWDITGELMFYRSFEYPVDARNKTTLAISSAEQVIFTFGPMYPDIVCLVEHANIDLIEFSPTLQPTKATVDISMTEVSLVSVNSDDIYSARGFGGF